MSIFNISGLSSGIDTNAIISQLLQVEAAPVTRLQQQQSQLRVEVNAWTKVNTRLSALRTAVNDLTDPSDFDAFVSTTSSNTDAVTATAASGAEPGSFSFRVDRLATRHQMGSETLASSDALVGTGSLDLTLDGTTHSFATDDTTTLSQLATSVNDAGIGISAQVVKIADGSYQLFLSSDDTGAANAFTIDAAPAGLGTFNTLQEGQDAKLTVGASSGNPVEIYRSSNTISDLIEGVTLTLKNTTTSDVTITTERDLDAAVEKVQAFIDEVNATLTELKNLSKYDVEAEKGGPLLGDPTARSLVSDLRSAVSNVVSGLTGDYNYAGSIGISMTREGTFELDTTKLRDALETDFDAVTNLFAKTASVDDPRLEHVFSSKSTAAGTYAVDITQAATTATVTGDPYAAPGADETFTITTKNGTAVDVTVAAGSDIATAVAAINDALSAAGVSTISAADDGTGAISLTESRYGSKVSFTVSGDGTAFGLLGTHTGTDVQGTIGGEAASGDGQLLTSTAGAADGLVVRVTATQAEVDGAGGSLAVGNVDVVDGIAGAVSRRLSQAEGTEGDVARAQELLETQIGIYQDRIEDFEYRLEQREITLRRQFAAMESALAKLSSQGNWLASALPGLNANSA